MVKVKLWDGAKWSAEVEMRHWFLEDEHGGPTQLHLKHLNGPLSDETPSTWITVRRPPQQSGTRLTFSCDLHGPKLFVFVFASQVVADAACREGTAAAQAAQQWARDRESAVLKYARRAASVPRQAILPGEPVRVQTHPCLAGAQFAQCMACSGSAMEQQCLQSISMAHG